MANPDEDLCKNTLFSERLRLAWEHFKFHAEQRTRMFHFFLIAAGLLVSAFSVMTKENGIYQEYAFIPLCIGGLLSTFFLCLDVRNAQLLEQSESLLRKIEEDYLYPNWTGEVDGKEIKLGILSREAVLKKHIQSDKEICNDGYIRWFSVDNIKHKISMRAIEGIGIVGFWFGAYAAAPAKIKVPIFGFVPDYSILIVGFIFGFWAIKALRSPERDLEWEKKALVALKAAEAAEAAKAAKEKALVALKAAKAAKPVKKKTSKRKKK